MISVPSLDGRDEDISTTEGIVDAAYISSIHAMGDHQLLMWSMMVGWLLGWCNR